MEFALVLLGNVPHSFERVKPATSQTAFFHEVGTLALQKGCSRCTVLILDAETQTFKTYSLAWKQDIEVTELGEWAKEKRHEVGRR